MLATILGIIASLLKLFGVGADMAREAKDQQVGVDLQAGKDAQDALDDTAKAIAARDAVVPLRPDGLRNDGTRDPDQRD